MRLECIMCSTPYVFEEVSQFEIALTGGNSQIPDLSQFFDTGDITVVRVPARLDVLGGIADYSGANVSEMTLECGVALGVQIRNDRNIFIRTLGINANDLAPDYICSLDDFSDQANLWSYQKIRAHFQKDYKTSWSAYIMGAIFVILKEKIVHELKHGLNIALISKVPIRVGIGSSATVEIATLHALNSLLGFGLDGQQLSRLGQLTENKVVGAPCGIMDQLTVTRGQSGALMHILCQPDIIKENIAIPENYEFVGINSKVHHNVTGSAYIDVRIGTFMGRKIISLMMQKQGLLEPEQFLDYLCNLTPEQFENHYRQVLPESMTGQEFLDQYGELGDTATTIDPETTYSIRSRTAHPIYENDRVLKFIDLLKKASQEDNEAYMKQVGRLMLASHDSYHRNCELSCPEVNQLVEMVKDSGKKYYLHGSKITGGGSGGTVAVVGKKKFMREAMEVVADKYFNQFGLKPDIFRGSSPGALQYGNRKYRLYR